MSGIYDSPVSTLDSGEEKYKPSVGWKILFFILLPLGVWSEYESLTINELDHSLWWLLASLVIYSIYYIGLFGLAFAKKFGTPKFWLYYLPIQIMTDFYEVYTLLFVDNTPVPEITLALSIVIPVLGLTWWSTYKYHSVILLLEPTAQ